MYKPSQTKSLYFPERITAAMARIFEYPLTIVEAPMGYGKTTAVREFMDKSHANVLWQRIYDGSIINFWNGFCRQLEEIDAELAARLLLLGFPDDSISLQEVVKLIEGIDLPEDTALVMDDYHLLNGTEVNSLIEYLVDNKLNNLHIILIARYIELSAGEEFFLKGYLYHIPKETLELLPKEISAYYQLCGISLQDADADKLYSYTEGWISALYLLMLDYTKEGSFTAISSIYKLVEKAVYMPFSDEIKEFLLNVCVFDSFTLEQARYMWPKENTLRLLTEIINRNTLVKYDIRTKTYQIHNILNKFLSDEFANRETNYKKQVYQQAAGWHMKTGDYLAAMNYYYIARDFEDLLYALEVDKGHSIHNEHKKIFIKCFEDCPEQLRQQHPMALLIYALCLFSFNEAELFARVCGEFAASMQNNPSPDSASINELMGEFELLLSFAGYNDIIKMLGHIEKAGTLLQHPAKFIDTQGGWTFGSPSVLYMFHREAGKLENEIENLKEALPFYNQLTNGHGTGGEFVMEAEWHFNRGDLENAAITSHKALYLANQHGQGEIKMCALFLQARIAFCQGDFSSVLTLFQQLHEEMAQKKWYNLLHTIDLCEAYIYAFLSREEKIPQWIRTGDFDSSRLYYPAMAFLNIVLGRVLLINGEYLKLLGISEQFMTTALVFPNLLGQIYSYIYVAASNERIFRRDDAWSALQSALDTAMPDQIYMPFVENCDYIKDLLVEFQLQAYYREDIARILAIYEPYQKAAEEITKEYFTGNKPALTEREMEIAKLAAQGLTNKEIGEQLFISANTVKMALKSIFSKLSINNRVLLQQYFPPA